MKGLHVLSFILLIIGGLNWLLFGVSGSELGTWLGGMDSVIAKTIYIIVGLAAIVELINYKKVAGGGGMSGQSGM